MEGMHVILALAGCKYIIVKFYTTIYKSKYILINV